MSKILDTMLGAALTIINFFEGLKSRGHDDPISAEWKALKRACVLSTATLCLGLAVAFVAQTTLQTLDEGMFRGQLGASLGNNVPLVATAVMGVLLLYCLYTYFALWRFATKHFGD